RIPADRESRERGEALEGQRLLSTRGLPRRYRDVGLVLDPGADEPAGEVSGRHRHIDESAFEPIDEPALVESDRFDAHIRCAPPHLAEDVAHPPDLPELRKRDAEDLLRGARVEALHPAQGGVDAVEGSTHITVCLLGYRCRFHPPPQPLEQRITEVLAQSTQ